MRKLRLLVPVSVIVAAVLLLMAPAGALAAPSYGHGGGHGENNGGCEEWYKVRCGDTLADIAWKYGTSVWELAEINDIENVNLIYRGQTLCVDSANGGWNGDNGGWKGHEKGGWHDDENGGFQYTVRCGDTIGDIAWKFGVNSTHLSQVNGLHNPNKIYVGQQLWIP
jgi:hypothetical protein